MVELGFPFIPRTVIHFSGIFLTPRGSYSSSRAPLSFPWPGFQELCPRRPLSSRGVLPTPSFQSEPCARRSAFTSARSFGRVSRLLGHVLSFSFSFSFSADHSSIEPLSQSLDSLSLVGHNPQRYRIPINWCRPLFPKQTCS